MACLQPLVCREAIWNERMIGMINVGITAPKLLGLKPQIQAFCILPQILGLETKAKNFCSWRRIYSWRTLVLYFFYLLYFHE